MYRSSILDGVLLVLEILREMISLLFDKKFFARHLGCLRKKRNFFDVFFNSLVCFFLSKQNLPPALFRYVSVYFRSFFEICFIPWFLNMQLGSGRNFKFSIVFM